MSQYKKQQIRWTQEKINLLRQEYPSGDKQLLAEKLGISRKCLNYAAKRFKVRSLTKLNKYSFSKLLEDNNISYYWHGFIMGDGNINEKGRLAITLSEKDSSHLYELSKIINCSIKTFEAKTSYTKGKYISLISSDVYAAKDLIKKYKIISPKTYNPPDLSCLVNKNNFISFFIGLFDADGCFDFRKSKVISTLKIEMHSSWENCLQFLSSKLSSYFDIESRVRKTSRGYVKLVITKYKHIQTLKKKAIELNLPILQRKWQDVDIYYVPKKFVLNNSIDKLISMVDNGKSWQDIAIIFGCNVESCKRKYKNLKQHETSNCTTI